MTDTPKQLKTNSVDDHSTPIDNAACPWDPRSPLQNRTPIDHDDTQVSLDATDNSTPQTAEAYNPLLDPRSPLYGGARTPVQCPQAAPVTDVETPPEVKCETTTTLNVVKNLIKIPKKKEGKDKNGKKAKEAKVVITQKPIKRQIAFTDTTNKIVNS